jgi:hypothetical protein
MRTLAAFVAVLGMASVASAQVPTITPATSVQVTVAGNGYFNGTTNCPYVGNGWYTGFIGTNVVRVVTAPGRLPNGTPVTHFLVSVGPSYVPSAPWQFSSPDLNGPTWNASGSGTTVYNPGTVTVRGM